MPFENQYVYALLGLTVMVALFAGLLTFAALRFLAAGRNTRRQNAGGAETALLSAALQEAVSKLRAQEQAMIKRIGQMETKKVQDAE